MTGYGLRKRCLVKAVLMESNAERFDRPPTLRLHQRDHEGGIYAPRKEGTQWNIRHHLLGDCPEQQRYQPLARLRIGTVKRMGGSRFRNRLQRPVRLRQRRILGADLGFGQRETIARRQFVNIFIDAKRRRDVTIADQQRQRVAVHAAVPRRVSPESF